MSDLPISSPYRSTPDAPVTEAERDRLATRLNAAYSEGTVDTDDYRARLDALFSAERMGDLVPVVAGLPPLATYNSPAIVPSGTGKPGELAEARPAGRLALIGVAGIGLLLAIIAVLFVVLL